MKIYDGEALNSPTIGGKLCGTNVPERITSSTNALKIQFRSDDNDVKGGAYRLKIEPGRNQHRSFEVLGFIKFSKNIYQVWLLFIYHNSL